MEPRYKSLTVSLIPLSREVPPPPFDVDDLQRIFSEVIRRYPYQTFEFLYGQRGAQFSSSPLDTVEIRPALLQVDTPMDGVDVLTAPMAEEKAAWIFKTATERLGIEGFLQVDLSIVALVDAPGGDAQQFMAERMLHDGDQASELGPGFIGAGVVFRSPVSDGEGENHLSIEPYFQDNELVFLNYNVSCFPGNQPPFSLERVSTLTSDAFEFLAGPTMRLLSR